MSKQLASQLADADGELPVPERVAALHGFKLVHHDTDGVRRYSVHDWLSGIAGFTDNKAAGNYWRALKRRANELRTRCTQLPYTAANGKSYRMDHADAETLYLITQRMEAGNGIRDNVLQYLAKAGVILDEMVRNPGAAAAAFSKLDDVKARRKLINEGFTEQEADQWLQVRREQKEEAKRLATEWRTRGVTEGRDYGRLNNEVQYTATGKTATELKELMQIKRTPRDFQSAADNVKVQIVSVTARALHGQRDSQGTEELSDDIVDVKPIIDAARNEIDKVFSKKPRRLPRG